MGKAGCCCGRQAACHLDKIQSRLVQAQQCANTGRMHPGWLHLESALSPHRSLPSPVWPERRSLSWPVLARPQ